MATINELVTRLSFKLDNRGAAAFDRRMQQMAGAANRAVNRMQSGFGRVYAKINSMTGGLASSIVGSFGKAWSMVTKFGQGSAKETEGTWRDSLGRLRDAQGRFVSDGKRGFSSFASSAGGSLGALNKQIAGMAVALGGSFGAAQTGNFVLGTAAEYENVIFSMKNVFGKEAPKLIEQLKALGAETPEEFGDLASNFTRLNAAGFTFNVEEFGKLADSAALSNIKVREVVDSMIGVTRGQLAMVDNIYGQKATENDGMIKLVATDIKTKRAVVTKMLDKDNIDANVIKEFYLQSASRNGVAGMAKQLSKTLGGKQSTFIDALKNAAFEFYSKFQGSVHKMMDSITKMVEELTPKIQLMGRYFGVFIKMDLPGILRAIKDLAPIAAWGIGLIVANMAGGKIIAFAGALQKLSFLMFVLEGAAALVNLAVGGLFLVAGAIMLDFIHYLTTGESKLGEFAAKWPWVKQGLESAYESWKIFYFALEIGFKKIWIQLKGWMGEVKYFAQYLWDSVLEPFKMYGENLRTTFDAVKELFGWISEKVKPLTDSLGRMAQLAGLVFNRGQGDDGMGNVGNGIPSPVAGSVGVNQSMANSLVKAAQVTKTAAGYCLNAVWRAQNLGLKNANLGDSKITAQHAADSAAQLARDPRFQEIKVTAQMMDDPKYARLLHGATAIFSRTSGYSPISGHAEIWDMQQRAALYGRGPKSLELSKSRLAGARVFVPRSNLDQMPAAPGAGAAPAPSASVVINQNFNGAANPSTVKRAAQEGTGTALNRSALTKPVQAAR